MRESIMVYKRPLSSTVAIAMVLILMAAVWLAAPPAFAEPDVTLVEYGANPVYNPPVTTYKEYYPCVLYDASRFSSHGVSYYYKMWYGDGEGVFFAVTYSNDGINWTTPEQLTGIPSLRFHSQVVYIPGGFNEGGGTYYYKIWYWDCTAVLSSIDAIRTADSSDGVNWANDRPLTQDATARLITGTSPDWNWGSYGPVSILYNPTASNSGSNPFDYSYAMYYDATTGAAEVIGLGYSVDGTHFYRYGTDPVLGAGPVGAWDGPHPSNPASAYDTAGTVIKGGDGTWRMWYSAWQYVGSPGTFTNYGIGYATSINGINWTRDADNPLFYITDGKAWRDAKTYTPSVLYSPTRFDGHGESSSYKMWFTGQTSATGQNAAIGYASSSSPLMALFKNASPSGNVGRGQVITYTIRARNDGNGPAEGCSLTDSIPQYTAYVKGTTTLNGTVVPDAGGNTPLVGGIPVHSPGQPAGTIAVGAGEQATVTYQVRVQNDLPPNWPISSIATLTGTGITPVQATYTNNGQVSQSPTWYLAEGTTAWGFSDYMSIENPNAGAVHAAITYMTGSGNVSGGTITLPAKSQTTVNPADKLGNRDFSTRVTCTEGKTIAVDRTMTWTGPGAVSGEGHSSVGVTSPAKTWYLPEGSSAWGFETWTLVQNPNNREATVTLTYMTEGAGQKVVQKKIPAYSRTTYSMAADIGSHDSSIEVTSDVPVIAERSQYRNNRREGSCSIGATTPAANYFLAEGATGYNVGYITYVLVQNPQNSPTNVTLTYLTQNGQVPGPSFQMPANSRKTVRVNDQLTPNTDVSTHVRGSKPIIAERATFWDNGTGEACHDSIGMSSAHTTFYLPDGQTSSGRETWTLVQNPNSSAVSVEVSYLKAGGGAVTLTSTIPANSRKTFNMADKITSGRASITVTSKTAGKKIMVERSMYWNNRGAGTDTIGGYSD